MKIRTSLFYLLLLISMIPQSSCELNYPEVTKVREIKFKGFNPLTKELRLSYKPSVQNPNSFDIWVDKVDTEIIFDGLSLGSTHSEKRIDLAANQVSEFPLEQKLKVKNFLKQLRGLMKKDSIKIELDGQYSFKAADYEVNIPYLYETYLYPKKDLTNLLLGL